MNVYHELSLLLDYLLQAVGWVGTIVDRVRWALTDKSRLYRYKAVAKRREDAARGR